MRRYLSKPSPTRRGTRLCWRTLSSTSIGSARSRLRKQHRAKASIRKKHWSRSTRPRSSGTGRRLITRGSNSATRRSPRRSAAALGFAWSIRGTLCTSLLDPFKGRITRLLDTHPYSAQQIFQRLREEGYGGGVTILRTYVRRIRPPKLPVYLKLHFAPGEGAQVDWGGFRTVAVGNTRPRLCFFVVVRAYSRLICV